MSGHLPVPDAETRPFWDALGNGRLLIKWCLECGRPHYFPRAFCPFCWSERTEWREASGDGVVFATTTVRQMGVEPFRSRVPYNVSIVELAEGPRMLTNVVGIDASEVRIGMEVRLSPERDGDAWLPLFRLA
jgi:uncharacterized OB-fold protein